MNYKKALFSLIGALITTTVCAQISLPTVTLGKTSYYCYQVEGKETIHSISQKTGVPADVIIEYNPVAATTMAKKQMLYIPVPQPTAETPKPGKQIIYTLSESDNLYTVAKSQNATVEDIISNNISLTPDKYVAGTKIKVTPNSAKPFTYEKTVIKFQNHTLQKNESLYSLAKQYETTEEYIALLNPNFTKIKKGKTIIIPKPAKVTATGTIATSELADLQDYYSPRVNDLYNHLLSLKRNNVANVGIILPFQLQNENAPKQAFLYTDFLKGFMLAMDSVGSSTTRKLNIKVYDTQHNLNVTDSLLALPEMKQLDLIIAPSEPQQLERINRFAQNNNIDVLNCFTAKSEEYKSNPNVLAVNTPTPVMVANLVNWLKTRFNECTFVFLKDNDATELFQNVKDQIGNVSTLAVNVDSELNAKKLSNLLDPGTNYVFIPSNSSKALLKKITPVLKEVKEERIDCEINLIGYPEYVLHLKDCQNDLMDVDTYMFSRFFNTKGFRTRNIESSYKKWYKGSMLESYPHMGLFGFDTGCYIINTLGQGYGLDDNTALYKGVQTGFKFSHQDDNSGLINQAITLIHFSPDKKIESFVVVNK